MELRQLRHFLAVAEHRNFGRAAEQLCITQQALSHSIAQLEKGLGARLFERGPRGAELTPVGASFQVRARLVQAELDLAAREVEAMTGGAKGQVRFGVSSAVASRLLPLVVARFSAMRPKVGLTIAVDHSRELYAAVNRGDLEFAVSTPIGGATADPEFEHVPLGERFRFDANFLVMRGDHPLLDRPSVSLDELRTAPWIMPETLSAHAQAILDLFTRRGLSPPEQIVRTDSFIGAKALIARSDFVALLGREAAALEIEAGLLAGIPLPGYENLLPGYCVIRSRTVLQPATRELIRMFQRVVDPGQSAGDGGERRLSTTSSTRSSGPRSITARAP